MGNYSKRRRFFVSYSTHGIRVQKGSVIMQCFYINKYDYQYKKRNLPAIFILVLTGLCWAIALSQLISSIEFSPAKSIPAFLSLQDGTAQASINNQASIDEETKQEEAKTAIPAFRPANQTSTEASQLSTDMIFSSPEEALSYLQSYDKDIRLVSSHQEANYLDLYFYSPRLQRSLENNSSFNIQVAVTKNHTYFGTPFINYDF